MLLAFVIVSCLSTRAVLASSSGPKASACDDMTPGHGVAANTGPSTYTVTLDKTTYSPNEVVQVTLTGTEPFKGFMIQPRKQGASDTYMTYGSFGSQSGTMNPCTSKGAGKTTVIAHSEASEKTSITLSWTAPATSVGDIVFVFTVVKSKSVFWVKQLSPVLTAAGASGGPATTPDSGGEQIEHTLDSRSTFQIDFTTTVKTPVTPATTGTANSFRSPTGCTTNCRYLVTWKNMGDDIEFTTMTNPATDNKYVSIGFSTDTKMGDDSVVDCVAKGGVVSVESSFNLNTLGLKHNVMLSPTDYGITSFTGSYANGELSCSFRRKKNAALVTSGAGMRRRRASPVTGDSSKFFDLSAGNSYFLFVAVGNVDGNGEKAEHGIEGNSPSKIDFTAITAPPGTNPGGQQPAAGAVQKDPDCGAGVGCYHDCKGDNCNFLFTWKDATDDVDFVLTCKQSGSVYCAIGFSSDTKMGDDSVVECVSNNGVVTAHASYNLKNVQDNVRLDVGDFGLTFKSGAHKDGVLSCSFSRKKTFALASGGSARRKRAAVTASQYVDLDQDWYLLYATGPGYGGEVAKHTELPIISDKMADLQSFEDISGSAAKNTLVKAHGILMTIAWLFCATIGIFMPRFYKTVWPEGSDWCGQKRWFQVHRALMMLAFLATAVAFVIIFIHVEGWAEISGSGFEKSHPIIGTIVMGLTLINPIMAFFRPHPGTKTRPIFKAAHTFVGVAAVVLGVINIFSGTVLPTSDVPDYIRTVLYVFVGVVVVISVILSIYDCAKSSKASKREEAYEMPNDGKYKMDPMDKGVDQPKVFLLGFLIVAVLALTLAVCVIIGLGDD